MDADWTDILLLPLVWFWLEFLLPDGMMGALEEGWEQIREVPEKLGFVRVENEEE